MPKKPTKAPQPPTIPELRRAHIATSNAVTCQLVRLLAIYDTMDQAGEDGVAAVRVVEDRGHMEQATLMANANLWLQTARVELANLCEALKMTRAHSINAAMDPTKPPTLPCLSTTTE